LGRILKNRIEKSGTNTTDNPVMNPAFEALVYRNPPIWLMKETKSKTPRVVPCRTILYEKFERLGIAIIIMKNAARDKRKVRNPSSDMLSNICLEKINVVPQNRVTERSPRSAAVFEMGFFINYSFVG
jgi:hypothetical protein